MSRPNDIKVSENFKLYEFESPDTKEVIVDPRLITLLQNFRNLIAKSVIINSGYRTVEHNREVGGVDDSQHRLGKAVDIKKIPGLTVDQMAMLAERVGFTGIGKYTWGIHVDVREEVARWDER
jgi:zinc D-Ala-D-Ala carboxypeptidase